jgi:GNAT superfamily N-acetyltransferase
MTVRRLAAGDWPELWPMLRSFGTNLPADEARPLYYDLLADPRWAILGYAGPDGRLIGYAAAQDYGPHLRAGRRHQGRLHDLYVQPEQRRTGAGRALMDAVVAWADGRIHWLEWQAHHERSAPFYEHLGFQGNPCPQPDYPTFELEFPS